MCGKDPVFPILIYPEGVWKKCILLNLLFNSFFLVAKIKVISTVVCVQRTPGSLNIETETAARSANADASPQGYDFWVINAMLDTEDPSKYSVFHILPPLQLFWD